MSLLSNSKSIQEPRFGMTRAEKMSFWLTDVLLLFYVEEDSRRAVELADTTTRSVPLMMNVPCRRHQRESHRSRPLAP